jgi:hypothetical protein
MEFQWRRRWVICIEKERRTCGGNEVCVSSSKYVGCWLGISEEQH